jgi:membrane-associated phospholipid phosphatase
MGTAYVGFDLAGMDRARSAVVDMGLATVLADLVILPIKEGVGRVRPADGLGDHTFKPLTSNDSFPSGHTTQAFAMASALSMHAGEAWVGWCAYGVASLVAMARVEARDHFASDVLAGALVGTTVGRAVAGFNRKIRTARGRAEFRVVPALAPGYRGVTVSARF